MINKENISSTIESYLSANMLYEVDITISAENDIEIVIDCDNGVDIKHCSEVSRIVDKAFDKDIENYSLTVTSAGLDQPIKIEKQFNKYIGKEVEILFKKGTKLVGTLIQKVDDEVEIEYSKTTLSENKKRKIKSPFKEFFKLDEIKHIKPYINFR